MQTDLNALIERVESGAGYDRQLEIDIWVALGWSHEKRNKDRKPWLYPAADGSTIFRRDPGDVVWWRLQHMDITESLDAVRSLIEAKLPEANCHGFDRDPTTVCAYVSRNHVDSGHWLIEGQHPKEPARALLAAALRAIQESRNDR